MDEKAKIIFISNKNKTIKENKTLDIIFKKKKKLIFISIRIIPYPPNFNNNLAKIIES